MMDKLRIRAEKLAQAGDSKNAPALTPAEMQQTLHELRVHQIELELQNEELRRSHAELDATRARYFDLYDLAPVGYCTLSPRGLIMEANLTAASLLGVTRSDMIGEPWTRFVFRDDQDLYYQQRKNFLQATPTEFDLRLLKKRETEFWAHISASISQDDEAARVCRIVMHDISLRKREEQFRENVERIIYHDIKGPLVNLFALAQMVMDGAIDESVVHFFPQIMLGIRQVIDLIDAAEPLRKMERGEYTAPSTPVDVHKLLNSVKQSLMVLSGQNRINVDIQIDTTCYPGRPPVCGEAFLLESMLMNLVKNAVEASPQDGHVSITCKAGENATCIAIHNVGEVPESIRDRFFEKNITAGKIYGTGLGTYSAQLIAKAHGGRIELMSSNPEGTTLSVHLPHAHY
ncbi:PAS domain-containing sensor histidine kinase [Desulfovibrio subterraneus]|uniref:PAS domain-containing sensor histidine kinase n=1 Tax=Desulfovibrio subterraneus TaxID=2718620 RepID=UPI0022B88F6E|nr:PAS domain-containing sensor histidine kinase [Desulfovibrio subterraneus]WBF67462.1 PAS domain-containing sensor histidine kinase [Desulfovibrio subterraneus]